MGYSNEGPGLELNFYSIDEGTVLNKPTFKVHLSAYSTTVPVPIIVVSPTSITKSGYENGTVTSTIISVTNYQTGAMTFTPTNDSAWLSLSCFGGCDAPDAVLATFDYGARPAGTYKDTIRIASVDASNTPVKIPVQLTISSAGSVTTATATKKTGLRK
jgi:hypothetical protein